MWPSGWVRWRSGVTSPAVMGPDRRLTAQELDALAEIVRRDPSSPSFVELAEAYLALGRPKQAIEVGMAGIAATLR